jgi:hypothetical protein
MSRDLVMFLYCGCDRAAQLGERIRGKGFTRKGRAVRVLWLFRDSKVVAPAYVG